MSKETSKWYSDRLGKEVQVVRWGEVGTPVLIFPTAAGDAEECERFLMIRTLAPLLEAKRIKLYSVDSVAGQAWLKEDNNMRNAARVQNAFDAFIYHELVPAIRTDCQNDEIEIMATGSSIGAFNALAAICRHPDVFSHAICMSGTYDLRKFLKGETTQDYYESSPLFFVPDIPEGEHLEKLRKRFVLLTHGEGRWEDPQQSWNAAEVLGAKGIPNRVDAWGNEWDHDWPTWREMLPKYLDEFLPASEAVAEVEAPARVNRSPQVSQPDVVQPPQKKSEPNKGQREVKPAKKDDSAIAGAAQATSKKVAKKTAKKTAKKKAKRKAAKKAAKKSGRDQ